jgi:hypothetical protein
LTREEKSKQKMRSKELAEKIGITDINVSLLKSGHVEGGATSIKGFFSTLRLGGWGFPLPKRPEPS